MTGTNTLDTHRSAAEYANSAGYNMQSNEGWYVGGSTSGYMSWMWRRAPGFFDVVAYEGDGLSGREIPHNLGVAPEMMWFKSRSNDKTWSVYSSPLGAGKEMALNLDRAAAGTNFFASTEPGSNVLTVGGASEVNATGWTYIAYLFASVPGISKVGSYTGNGELQVIDCGFDLSGQSTRGLLIKRTDSTGDWAWFYPHESNGMNLAYRLHLNDTSAGVRQNDVDAGFGGFRLQPTAPENILGAEYIFYAIAE